MERVEKVLEESDVRYNIQNDFASVEFWTDIAGQDINVEFNFDGTPEMFVKEFTEYAETYDVDEETKIWLPYMGTRSVPTSVKELLDSCQEAKDTLMEISAKLKEAVFGNPKNPVKTMTVKNESKGELPMKKKKWFEIDMPNGARLVAEANTDDYKEIFVGLTDINGNWMQDLVIIGEKYKYNEAGEKESIPGVYTVKVYADEMREDYTDEFEIKEVAG